MSLGRSFHRLISICVLALFCQVASAQNIVINPGFESGTSNWVRRTGGTLQSVTPGRTGSNAARLYNRTSTSHGIEQSMPIASLQNGSLCTGSVWVKTDSPTPVSVELNIQQDDSGADIYSRIGSAQVANVWTEIKGNFGLHITGTLVSLKLYLSGAPSGVEIFADDASFGKVVIPAPDNILVNPAIESNLNGWIANGGATIQYSSASHTGPGCIESTRTAAYQGVAQNMFGKMRVGQTYFVSAWARTDSLVTENVKLTFRRNEGTNPYYTNIASEQVPSGCWVWLSGYYTPQPLLEMTDLLFYAEGPAAGVKLYFDDAYIAPVTGLRKAAANFPGVRLGSIMGTDRWSTNVKFANTHAGHFHLASTENDTKFAGIEGQQNVFNYTKSNGTIDFSQAHGGASRGHCHVWHGDSVPTWVTGVTRTPAEMQSILWNHIDNGTTYCRDRLPYWDVVNEAVVTNGTLRTTATSGAGPTYWYDNPGIGYAADGRKYIAESFKRARMSDPDAKLFYNDFATNFVNSKSTGVYDLIVGLLADGAPVDGIGFQSHFSNSTTFDVASAYTNMLRFQNLGLDIHMSEVDHGLPIDANGFASAADLENQGKLYFDLLGTSLGFSRMKLFQVWGVYDGASWIPGASNNVRGQPLPFDFNFDKKPAFWGMWNALAGQAEKLTVLATSSGDTSTLLADLLLNAASGRRLNANAANDFITLKVEVPFKGSWNIKTGILKTAAAGKFQLAIAPPGSNTFVNVGSVQETYGTANAAAAIDLGTTDFSSAGDWQFRFTVPSKNSSSSGFALTLDYIRISPVSCDPQFTQPLADQSILQNEVLTPTLFIAEDDTAGGSLVVTASSSNPALVPDSNLLISGASPYYTFGATPLPNQVGSSVITLTANDGTRSSSQTFTLTVEVLNDTPTISTIADYTTPEDISLSGIPFTTADLDTPSTALTVQVSSSNTNLVPNENIIATVVPWVSADIGAVAAAGSSVITDSVTIQASGADFYGTADEGHFVYQAMSGDGETVARVTSLQNTNIWAKAGVMMRENLSAGSANAYMHVSATQGVEFSSRVSSGAVTTNTSLAGITAPCWVRLVRSGNTFTGYYAADASGGHGPWIQVGTTATIPGIGTSLMRGLAATSHNDGILGFSTFHNISGPTNRLLTVIPAANQTGTSTLIVTVSDGTSSSSTPFSVTVTPVNDAPMITSINNQQLTTNNSSPPLAFTIADLETSPSLLQVTATTSNPLLVPPSGIAISGSSTNRSVTISPMTGQLGSTTITLTVDDGNLSTAATFLVTVTGTGLETSRFQYYGTASNSGQAADTVDTNGDGERNLLEYATGQNPSASTRAETPAFLESGQLRFSYPRSQLALADGIVFMVESSATLTPFSWNPAPIINQSVTGTGTTRLVTIETPDDSQARKFLRLNVTAP